MGDTLMLGAEVLGRGGGVGVMTQAAVKLYKPSAVWVPNLT